MKSCATVIPNLRSVADGSEMETYIKISMRNTTLAAIYILSNTENDQNIVTTAEFV